MDAPRGDWTSALAPGPWDARGVFKDVEVNSNLIESGEAISVLISRSTYVYSAMYIRQPHVVPAECMPVRRGTNADESRRQRVANR